MIPPVKEFTAAALPPGDQQRPGKKMPDTEITVKGGSGGMQTLLYCHSTDVEWIMEALRLMNALEIAAKDTIDCA